MGNGKRSLVQIVALQGLRSQAVKIFLLKMQPHRIIASGDQNFRV